MTLKTSKWEKVRKNEIEKFMRHIIDCVNGGASLYDATWQAMVEVNHVPKPRARMDAVLVLAAAGHDVEPILQMLKAEVDNATIQ